MDEADGRAYTCLAFNSFLRTVNSGNEHFINIIGGRYLVLIHHPFSNVYLRIRSRSGILKTFKIRNFSEKLCCVRER